MDSFAQKKRAQTTMKFLSTPLDARAAGMADAHTALQLGSTAMFYNPASMAQMEDKVSITAGYLEWIADITYNSAAVAYRPSDGRYGVVGVHMSAVDYGEFRETIISDNEDGFLSLGTYSPTSISAGISYAYPLSSEFMIGANIKYVSVDLGNAVVGLSDTNESGYNRREFRANTAAYDFGLLYKIGFESLRFAMSVRNFASEVAYDSEETELPLTFRIGLSMDLVDLTSLNPEMHQFIFAVDANRPRDYYEQIMLGGEYTFMNRFSLRGGYVFPADESNLSFGAGIRQPVGESAIQIDYSYTAFGIFENVQRLGVKFGF
jgi:hypothetical protein